MPQGAKVDSIDALKSLKIALWKFAEATDVALGDAEAELQRVLAWLEMEQTTYWQGQIRKRHELVEKAKEAVRMKRNYKDSSGKPQSAVEEEKQLRIAQQREEEAIAKNALVRRSIPMLQKEIQAYKGGVQRLATAVQQDLPSAATELETMIGQLEQYLSIAPAAASSAASISSQASAPSEASEAVESMARGRQGEEAPPPPQAQPPQSPAENGDTPPAKDTSQP